MTFPTTNTPSDIQVLKVGAHLSRFIEAVNFCVKDERRLRQHLAIFGNGQNLTSRLSLQKETGWFKPLLADVIGQKISIIINDIPLTDVACAAVEEITKIPADWISQQNLYITPDSAQAFDSHCDPHIVVAVQLYGHKKWNIFERSIDNPLILDNDRSVLAADKTGALKLSQEISVEPGDLFVIPRGRFHSAVASGTPSVHLAIGCAGVRPVDVLWEIAQTAMQESTMRSDMDTTDAVRTALEFIKTKKSWSPGLPRSKRRKGGSSREAAALLFKEVLDRL